MENTNQATLIRAYDVGRRLGYSTPTVKRYAKAGILPGAVFIGKHVRFDPVKIEEFISNGGFGAPLMELTGVNITHHGARNHAGHKVGRKKRKGRKGPNDSIKSNPSASEPQRRPLFAKEPELMLRPDGPKLSGWCLPPRDPRERDR